MPKKSKSRWSWTKPSRRNPKAKTAKKVSDRPTVQFWQAFLVHKLTRYDMAESKREMKRRGGQVNIYRLGLLLKAAQKAEKAVPAKHRKSSSKAALESFRAAMHEHLLASFAPVKAVDRAIDTYLETGRRPKLGGGTVATSGARKNPAKRTRSKARSKAKSRRKSRRNPVKRARPRTLQAKKRQALILRDVKEGGGRWMTLEGTHRTVGGTKPTFDSNVAALVSDGKLEKRGFLVRPAGGVKTVAKARSVARKARRAPARKAAKKMAASYDKLTKGFNSLRAAAARKYGRLARVALKVDPKIHDSARHYAMTIATSPGAVITVAPELVDEPISVIRGVLRHEFGHAAVMMGLVAPSKTQTYDAIERHADRTAERIFNTKIYYDKRGVEVSGPGAKGRRPRPAGLR